MCHMGCKRENEQGKCIFPDEECILITAAENSDKIDDVMSFIFSPKNVNNEEADNENRPKRLSTAGVYMNSVIKNNIELNKKDPKCRKQLLDNMLEQLPKLLSSVRDDYESKESIKIKNEFMEMIKDKHISVYEKKLDSKSMANTVGFMTELMIYKGRGYIVFHEGRGYYSYYCTVEEMLVNCHSPKGK